MRIRSFLLIALLPLLAISQVTMNKLGRFDTLRSISSNPIYPIYIKSNAKFTSVIYGENDVWLGKQTVRDGALKFFSGVAGAVQYLNINPSPDMDQQFYLPKPSQNDSTWTLLYGEDTSRVRTYSDSLYGNKQKMNVWSKPQFFIDPDGDADADALFGGGGTTRTQGTIGFYGDDIGQYDYLVGGGQGNGQYWYLPVNGGTILINGDTTRVRTFSNLKYQGKSQNLTDISAATAGDNYILQYVLGAGAWISRTPDQILATTHFQDSLNARLSPPDTTRFRTFSNLKYWSKTDLDTSVLHYVKLSLKLNASDTTAFRYYSDLKYASASTPTYKQQILDTLNHTYLPTKFTSTLYSENDLWLGKQTVRDGALKFFSGTAGAVQYLNINPSPDMDQQFYLPKPSQNDSSWTLLYGEDTSRVRTYSDSLYGRKAQTNTWTGRNYWTGRSTFGDSIILRDYSGNDQVTLSAENYSGTTHSRLLIPTDAGDGVWAFGNYGTLLVASDTNGTRSYSDSLYGRKASTNIWTGTNYFRGLSAFSNTITLGTPGVSDNSFVFYRGNGGDNGSVELRMQETGWSGDGYVLEIPYNINDDVIATRGNPYQTFTGGTWNADPIDTSYTYAIRHISLGSAYGIGLTRYNGYDFQFTFDSSKYVPSTVSSVVSGSKTFSGLNIFSAAFTNINPSGTGSARLNFNDSGQVGSLLPGWGGGQWGITNGTAVGTAVDAYGGRAGQGVFKIGRRGSAAGDGSGAAFTIDSLLLFMATITHIPIVANSFDLGKYNAYWDSSFVNSYYGKRATLTDSLRIGTSTPFKVTSAGTVTTRGTITTTAVNGLSNVSTGVARLTLSSPLGSGSYVTYVNQASGRSWEIGRGGSTKDYGFFYNGVQLFGMDTVGKVGIGISGTVPATNMLTVKNGLYANAMKLQNSRGQDINWIDSLGAMNAKSKSVLDTIATSHLIGQSSAPTIAAGTGAGTSPSVSIVTNSTDLAGEILVRTGTTPTANGDIVTVTFNKNYTRPPQVVLTPSTGLAAAHAALVYIKSTSGSTFVVTDTVTALTASQVYRWKYHVIE